MIEAPQIVGLADRPLALIHLIVPRDEMKHVIMPGLAELRSVLASQSIKFEPGWVAHHLTLDAEQFDFEMCFVVERAVEPQGRVESGLWPAGKVARTTYAGDYPGLPGAWGELAAWMRNNNHRYCGDIWERYLVTASSNPNPSTWQTEMSWRLL